MELEFETLYNTYVRGRSTGNVWARSFLSGDNLLQNMTLETLKGYVQKSTGFLQICSKEKDVELIVCARDASYFQTFYNDPTIICSWLYTESDFFVAHPVQIELNTGVKIAFSNSWGMEKNFASVLGEKVIPLHAKSISNGEVFPVEQYPIGFVVENKIYFNFALHDDMATQVLVEAVLHEAAPLVVFPKPLSSLETFKTVFESFLTASLNRKKNLERELTSNTAYYLREYIEKERELQLIRVELISHQENLEAKKTKAEDLYTFMEKHRKISSFSFQNGSLQMIIKDLSMSYGGDTRELPPFNVKMNITSGEMSISLHKVAMRHEKWASIKDTRFFHPHINENGIPCMGNFREIYAKVLASGEFKQVIELLLEFLQSYNPGSPYNSWDFYANDDKYPKKES